ncbi:helix-turn-helix domain-containing protein [Streptosporangium sp. NPDC005286]|uniref:winged helix-turn-helix transcriptional regulator n=1 Tax=Streptosporangium sp. NPDC005286 TaxID=3154463 RepID=UPI0033ABE2BD
MEEGTSKSPSHCADTGSHVDARQWDTREDCEVRQILDRVADKWSLLVIALLDRRTLRFTELSREIDGVSQRMLTVTLRHLERDGLVRRTVHPVVPPRVDYDLTSLGVTLHDTIQSLVTWTERHQNEIAAARADYDARAEAEPAVAGRDGARGAMRRDSATKRDNVTVNRNETWVAAAPRNESRAGVGPSGCEVCGAPIHVARTGRPARFCGAACRQKAHRRRSGVH